MALLSAATLLLQVALTRFFSIAQFYHFAFLVVSLALLGFGASGSFLAIAPRFRQRHYGSWYALGFALTSILAYLFVNHLPFDSYSIAWDRRQVLLMIANLIGLAVPFTFAGALIATLLIQDTKRAGIIYGANLLGSAVGAMSAPLAIGFIGSEQAIMLCVVLAAIAAMLLAEKQLWLRRISFAVAVGSTVLVIWLPGFFEIQPSEYKALSHFSLNPDAEIVATRQNAYSRLDVIRSPTIHSAQGMSLSYLGSLPPQAGLLLDGDTLLPVPDTHHAPSSLAQAMPAHIAYNIRPQSDVLVLGAGGGMDVWVAVENNARQVNVIEPNRLVYDVLTKDLNDWFTLANNPSVRFEHEQLRTFARRHEADYDVVYLTLRDNYRPISSGAFSLTENYELTVEAFEDYLDLCGDDGLLVLTRWLQQPPSESLRTLALILEALDTGDPLAHIVVFRSFQTATFIVKPTPFTSQETEALLEEISELRYDLVLAPIMPASMINQYARLDSPVYHDTFLELANQGQAFIDDYEFRVEAPTDNRPFFFHFFRWQQTPDIINNLGKKWQPFGGSGYFVLIALLGFAIFAALLFVLTPIAMRKPFRLALGQTGGRPIVRILSYFTLLGLAFLLVEIALIQRYMLSLGQPTLAIATVISALLFFSGLGSTVTHSLPWRPTLFGLSLLLMAYPLAVNLLIPTMFSLSLGLRIGTVVVLIAPVGFLMGMPFARGLAILDSTPDLVPWAWAVNGSASVVSAVLTAILALSYGFTIVLWIGGGLYLLAGLFAQFQPQGNQTSPAQ
jgi:spermidine synthase